MTGFALTTARLTSAAVCCALALGVDNARTAHAADWPMWRYNAARGAATPDALPERLEHAWTIELPLPRPAWPATQGKLQFDAFYEPVVAGKRLFVPSMVSDSVTAFDTTTGHELWRFYADGPVRFAPIAHNDSVYFVSDDGHLYSVSAADGALQWKVRGGPGNRKVLGNGRLISAWPARGAPVLYDGTIYFGASIWPFMGIFIHAVDAGTGEIVWTNSGRGADYITQQHGSPAFAGVAPQGYFAATADHLLVTSGRSMPAVFDRRTGELLHFDLANRDMKSKGGGGYGVMATPACYVNGQDTYDVATGKYFAKTSATVFDGESMIGADSKGRLVAYAPHLETKTTKDRKGKKKTTKSLEKRWTASADESIERIFLQAGSRIYGTTKKDEIVAVDVPTKDGAKVKVAWSTSIADAVRTMIAADGKLFVMTDFRIHCFASPNKRRNSGLPQRGGVRPDAPGRGSTENILYRGRAQHVSAGSSTGRVRFRGSAQHIRRGGIIQPIPADDPAFKETTGLITQTGVLDGYCIVLGVGDGRLIEALARQSRFQIVAVDADAAKVDMLRRRLDAADLYGTRVAAHSGDPSSFPFPPYLANLIVVTDSVASAAPSADLLVRQVYRALRPYGGTACFARPADTHDELTRVVLGARLQNALTRRAGAYSLVTRVGALPGAGSWTHNYGDAGNTIYSSDRLVRAPLGLLWFGGASHAEVLPRHGHGPAPQVIGGRLFIEGPDMLRAVDVYTGRVLWQRALPGLGAFYGYTGHQPGAGVIGSNYVSVADGVYVVHEDRCLRLDPATGETRQTFSLPAPRAAARPPTWGSLAVWEDLLVAGASPVQFDTFAFNARELRGLKDDKLETAVAAILAWKTFDWMPKRPGEHDRDFVRNNLNRMLADPGILERIPSAVRTKAEAEKLEKQLADLLDAADAGDADAHGVDPRDLEEINRRLLEKYYGLPKYKRLRAGQYGAELRKASRRLVIMNRHTGEVLWTFDAEHAFRHNTIVVGGGKVFALDRVSDAQAAFRRRRGMPPALGARIVALDARTGKLAWSTDERIFGTWLGYSSEHDVLLQAGSAFGDRALDETKKGMVAYRGATGQVLWENDLSYAGPCILYHDRVITQGYGSPGVALHILTGEKRQRPHPLTGTTIDWGYTRNYGCNTAIASEHLLTFRSSAAGYYDLAGDGGTGNFGGFRSGCTSNLVVADGVLNAPDYTRTCTCSYPNQTSLALVPMADVEMWTLNKFAYDGAPVRRVGLNFGAPGDRYGPGDTLWLDFPSVGGKSPDLPVKVEPADATYFRYHASHVTGPGLPWIAASGIEGASSITITLAEKGSRARTYTVRLHFAETARRKPGQRVFSVQLAGTTVLEDFDIVRQAGGPNRALVREFRGISVTSDLEIALRAKRGKPLLCGVEIVAEP